MDVRLPDGTIINNVPDGITKAQLTKKLASNGYDVSKLYQEPTTSMSDVVMNAPQKAIAGMADFYNNIGKIPAMAYGTAATALGRPDLAPDIQPDTYRKGAESIGLINPNSEPQTPAQRIVDRTIQGGTGMLIAPGRAVTNALLGAGSGLAGGVTKELTGSEGLAGTAQMATPFAPSAINSAGNKLQSGARSLMQSAIKPTIKQLKTGDAQIAVQTLLDNGLSPNAAGVDKLRSLISDKNDEIKNIIGNSTATVSKQRVLNGLDELSAKFSNQVSPTSDLNAIQSVRDDFMTHPNLPRGDAIPIQQAQEMKQGTYKVLAKKYGQIGTADTEAQKSLARGLKEGISEAIPEIQGLNQQETNLIKTLDVTERRAFMELNKNPIGLTALAHNPAAAASFMADRSAAFKSLVARIMNKSGFGIVNNLPPQDNQTNALRSLLTYPNSR